MEKKVLDSMFKNLLHIGNKTTYINPKMKEYIYGAVNWIHVFDLTKTAHRLESVKKALEEASKEGKKILFVATKLQSRDAFAKLAVDTGNFYVNEKWVPWLLTNFKTISKRIAYYLRLLKDSQRWAWDVLTKKEKASKMLELEKLDRVFKWLKEMKKLPDIIFVADGVYDKKALVEANKIGRKSYAILNTNGDIDLTTDFIPANTNSVKSVTFIAESLSNLPKASQAKKTTVKRTNNKPKVSWAKKVVVKKTAKKEETKTEEKKEVKRKAPAKKTTAKKDEAKEVKKETKKTTTKKTTKKEVKKEETK